MQPADKKFSARVFVLALFALGLVLAMLNHTYAENKGNKKLEWYSMSSGAQVSSGTSYLSATSAGLTASANTQSDSVSFYPGFWHDFGPIFLCGDSNSDGQVNVSDAVFIINYVFVAGSPAPDPLESADTNCDQLENISDAVWIINYVFVSGYAPCDVNGDSVIDC